MEIAVLALGCFWGPEKKYGQLEGVYRTEVGYCGGNSPNTNYREVCTGTTNHAEAVKLEFDPKVISYEEIIKKFFESKKLRLTAFKYSEKHFIDANLCIIATSTDLHI